MLLIARTIVCFSDILFVDIVTNETEKWKPYGKCWHICATILETSTPSGRNKTVYSPSREISQEISLTEEPIYYHLVFIQFLLKSSLRTILLYELQTCWTLMTSLFPELSPAMLLVAGPMPSKLWQIRANFPRMFLAIWATCSLRKIVFRENLLILKKIQFFNDNSTEFLPYW